MRRKKVEHRKKRTSHENIVMFNLKIKANIYTRGFTFVLMMRFDVNTNSRLDLILIFHLINMKVVFDVVDVDRFRQRKLNRIQ
jgi:hypothetical protein